MSGSGAPQGDGMANIGRSPPALVGIEMRTSDMTGMRAFYEALGLRVETCRCGTDPDFLRISFPGMCLTVRAENPFQPASACPSLIVAVQDPVAVRRSALLALSPHEARHASNPNVALVDPDGRSVRLTEAQA